MRLPAPGEGISVLRDDAFWPVNSLQAMAHSLLMIGLY